MRKIRRNDGKILQFILMETMIAEVKPIKELDMIRYHHNVIQEKIMLLRDFPEEPPHHYVAKDNLPMMVEA